MSDAATMTASDAAVALAQVIKPLRTLLEVEKILAAAVALEREAHDHADEIAARREEREQLDAELAQLKGQRQSAEEDLLKTKSTAAKTLEQAKIDAARVLADAEAAAKAILAKAADGMAQAEDKVHACEQDALAAIKLRDDTKAEIESLADELAAATKTIALAKAINQAMGK